VTQRPIARSAVLPFFEGSLRAAGLALIPQNGGYVIVPVDQARGQAQPIGDLVTGFGTESVTLRFVGAEQLRKLLDPLVPGVVVSADPGSNVLTIAGTTGQRASVRDLIGQFDVNWLRNMSFALYMPQRTDSRLIVPELEKLINGPGAPTAGLVRLISMERLNGILAISPQPQYLEDVRRWVEVLDREGENNERRLFVYRVQNGRSSSLAKTLITAFGNGNRAANSNGPGGPDAGAPPTGASPPPSDQGQAAPGDVASRPGGGVGSNGVTGANGDPITISSDDSNNAVVVFATSRDYAVIEDALRKLDLPPLQVMIEAAITEVTLNKNLSYGVQWLFQQKDGSIGYSEGKTSLPTQIYPGLSGIIAKQSITATLNALSKLTHINVVSAPKLMVLNNQTASLQVGDQVPVTTASAVGIQNADAPIVNQVEYRDTGVILKVTPRVNSGGLVLLDIAQEVSAVSQTTTSNIDSPTISTRKVATSVAVQDGETIALGGLITDRKEKGKNGIPILSTLPLIGSLFGTHATTATRTELVVLLKPRVIRTVDDGRAITDELREKLRNFRAGTKIGDFP
jgi:general secretion pathway protein D